MRGAIGRVGGIVLAAALATGVLAAPAQAEPSTITGTITAADTGQPVVACLDIYDLDYNGVAFTCTDDLGQYTAEGLTAGAQYKVWVNSQDSTYRSNWADGADDFETTTAHTAPATVDASLQLAREVGTATLSGTLVDATTGTPVPGCLDLWTADDSYLGTTCVDGEETSSWQFDRLVEGAGYKVHASSFDDSHVATWFDGAQRQDAATIVTAPASLSVGLPVGGRLEGTLTRADGSPVQWAWVVPEAPDGSGDLEGASTDESGNWSVLVPAGSYSVRFDAYPAVQWAFGKETRAEADVVSVAPGATTRVDDQLLPGATVQGVIRADGSRAPIEGACVQVVALRADYDQSVGEGCTDASGHYSVDVPTAGTYATVVKDPSGRFVGEYSGNTRNRNRATTFTLVRGGTQVVNSSLAVAASISGTAVDKVTGAPVADICPFAYNGNTGQQNPWSTYDCSDSHGRWVVRGLPAGDYTLQLDGGPGSPYAGTWAFNAATQADATLVPVSAGQAATVRPVKMSHGGTLSGRITGPTGDPVAGAWVNIDAGWVGRAGPGEGRYTAQTGADGRYTITGAPLGDHKVFVYDGGPDLAPEWSGDSATKRGATTVRIRQDRTTVFDAQLEVGARVTGEVVTSAGLPTSSSWVGGVYAADGTYIGDFDVFGGNTFSTTTLPAGRFTLRLVDPETGTVVWYDGATTRRDATRVQLSVGEQEQVTVHVP